MSVNPNIITIGGPTYGGVLFPFTFSSGTLDLPSGWGTGKTAAPANDGALIRMLGGNSPVTSVGTNLKNYILNVSNFGGYKVQNTSSISVVSGGIVTRVQQLGTQNLPTIISNSSYKISTFAPVTGFVQYASSWVFDEPVVISAMAKNLSTNAITTIYITFYTHWYH